MVGGDLSLVSNNLSSIVGIWSSDDKSQVERDSVSFWQGFRSRITDFLMYLRLRRSLSRLAWALRNPS